MKLVQVSVDLLRAGPLMDYLTALAGGFVMPLPHSVSVQKLWASGLAYKPSTVDHHCFKLIDQFKMNIESPKGLSPNWSVWCEAGFHKGLDPDLKVAMCKSLIKEKLGTEVTYDADIFEGIS